MRVVEDIEPVAFDNSAAVENFDWLFVIVAGNNNFAAERNIFRCRDESVAP